MSKALTTTIILEADMAKAPNSGRRMKPNGSPGGVLSCSAWKFEVVQSPLGLFRLAVMFHEDLASSPI